MTPARQAQRFAGLEQPPAEDAPVSEMKKTAAVSRRGKSQRITSEP